MSIIINNLSSVINKIPNPLVVIISTGLCGVSSVLLGYVLMKNHIPKLFAIGDSPGLWELSVPWWEHIGV